MKSIVVLILFLIVSANVFADVPAGQQDEVKHLIEFIRHTDCRLQRNEDYYSGAEALEHILRKYEYYRDEINNTEDFIDYSASKSEITGKAYVAHCEGQQTIAGRQWLMNELQRYRDSIKTQ